MSIENTIIEQLDNMAQVALKPEDMEQWYKTKAILRKHLGPDEMHVAAQEALQQLSRYNGSDFQFEKTDPPIEPGTIAFYQLGEMMPPIPAYIRARHEYSGKWKYDLEIAVKRSDAWHTTRIYNVESDYIKKDNSKTLPQEIKQDKYFTTRLMAAVEKRFKQHGEYEFIESLKDITLDYLQWGIH